MKLAIKRAMKLATKKRLFGVLLIFLCVAFAVADETILLPDLSTDISGWSFSVDEDAIPAFSVALDNDKGSALGDGVFATNSLADTQADTQAGTQDGSQNATYSAPAQKSDLHTDKDNSLAAQNATDYERFLFSFCAKAFMQSNTLGLTSSVNLDFVLSTKYLWQNTFGLKVFSQNKLCFDGLFDTRFFVKEWLPVDLFFSLGTDSFATFADSFYANLGAVYKFSNFENTLSFKIAKTPSIIEKISFSTDYKKYCAFVELEIPIQKAILPIFAIGGKYCFYKIK